jgi:hypothetical protein
MPTKLVIDDTFAFWLTEVSDEHRLVRVRKTGGSAEVLRVFTDITWIRGLAQDSLHLWVIYKEVMVSGRRAHKQPKDGTSGPSPFVVLSGAIVAQSLDVLGTKLVYGTTSGQVYQNTTNADAEAVLASGQGSVNAIALAGPDVYWLDGEGGRIVEHVGGTTTVRFTDAPTPVDLAVDDQSLYWSNLSGTINKLDRLTGTDAEQVATSSNPDAIALDDTHVYWCDAIEATVLAAPKAGGSAVVIATDLVDPVDLAVDDDAVFVADRATGQILRIAKP